MAKTTTSAGCLGGVCLLCVITFIGYCVGQEPAAWVAGGICVIMLLMIFYTHGDKKCELCGTPIRFKSYHAVVNGSRVNMICSKCKVQITDEIRREKMAKKNKSH